MAEVESNTTDVDCESPSPTKAKVSHPVLNLYDCTNIMQQHFKCKLCSWVTVGTSVRRKLEHSLAVRTKNVKPCSKEAEVPLDQREELLECLQVMNSRVAEFAKRKACNVSATTQLTTPKRQRQRKITVYGQEAKDEIDMEYTRMIVMTATKSNFLDSVFVTEFFGKHFNYTPPSRKVVMGALLDLLFEDTQKKVKDFINFKDADTFVTVSMDGWQLPTGEHIRNYMWVTDQATFFFTATNAGTVRPTGANIGAEALDVIERTGPENVAAVTNDNAEAETTSWETIRNAHPQILATGCTTHAGALLVKDVCEHAWATKLIEKNVFIAKFFKHHQFCNAEVRRRTKEAHNQTYAMILHGATRFAGVYFTLKRNFFLRTILREIAVSGGFEERRFKDADKLKDILMDSSFWTHTNKLRCFLKPLKCYIRLVDHDCNTTHHVYHGMHLLHKLWTENEPDVPRPFQTFALRKLMARWEFLQFFVHCITYGLSPNYHADNIFANARVMRGLKEVVKFFATNNGDYQTAMKEFTALKNHNDADIFPTDGNGTIITGMSPKSWWQMHGASWPILQPIAIRVFSIGTSSSTSERNFSTWSHIWSNRANSLTFERAVKMVYIYTNLRMLHSIRADTQRTDHVEADWLELEIEE